MTRQVSLDTPRLGMPGWFAYLAGEERLPYGRACQRTGGMVYLTKPSWKGVAWM